jgi:hypothetical protein
MFFEQWANFVCARKKNGGLKNTNEVKETKKIK